MLRHDDEPGRSAAGARGKQMTWSAGIQLLLERIAKLEAALRWYADEKNYKDSIECYSPCCEDEGERARAALASAGGDECQPSAGGGE